jgi:CDP-diacylglycerol--serine O-phosphatidyltransferase
MKSRHAFKKDNVRKGIYVLPNLFTTASLFAGFYSLINSMRGQFQVAAVAILVAAVLDALDGRIARMTNTTSKFGAEYDSLADLVAFGLAPAVMAYMWSLKSFGNWGLVVAFLFIVCGALRLARFNVQIGIIESRVFNGLPIPGAAAVVATSVLIFYKLGGHGGFEHVTVVVGVFVLALFMVSSIKYYSFKDLNIFSRKPFMSLVVIILILVVIVAEPQIMLFTFSAGYSLSGPTWLIYRICHKKIAALRGEKTSKILSI